VHQATSRWWWLTKSPWRRCSGRVAQGGGVPSWVVEVSRVVLQTRTEEGSHNNAGFAEKRRKTVEINLTGERNGRG
jgi:hypothetical protein